MKQGDFVFVKSINRYGYVHETIDGCKVKTVKVMNHDTGKFDIIYVLNQIVEAVGLIKGLIVIIRSLFSKNKIV